MPKQRNLFIDIPKLYRRQSIDLIMYGFIHGLKKAMPSMSTEECIEIFKDENNISEDELPLLTASCILQRMRKEFIDNAMELK